MKSGVSGAATGAEKLYEQGLQQERPSLGPIPISRRLQAVGEILAGVAKGAAGAAEYTTAPLMAPVRSTFTQPDLGRFG
jgi:hypothetical protein